MFTGIIQTIGTLTNINPTAVGSRISINIGKLADEITVGGSVAINGVCLTATKVNLPETEFDVIHETLSRTNLGKLKVNDRVNIELPLRPTDRLDGHIILGHIDTTCKIIDIQMTDQNRYITFELTDPDYQKYLVPKGSIAIDGISLTLVDVTGPRFSIAFIPETLRATTMGEKTIGDILNVETDIIVKAIVRQLEYSGLIKDNDKDKQLKRLLIESGFIKGA